MKKLIVIIAVSLMFTGCASLRGNRVEISGQKELTVTMVAKRGSGALVRFKEIAGTFQTDHCNWVKGQVVIVTFKGGNNSTALKN